MQSASGGIERVTGTATLPVEIVLDPAPAPVQRVAGEPDDVEGFHHRDRGGSSSVVVVLKPAKPSIATTCTDAADAADVADPGS